MLYIIPHVPLGVNFMFISITGFDYLIVKWLEVLYQPILVLLDGCIAPIQQGMRRPRLIDAADCFGLYVSWTWRRGSTMALQLILG
jgi:hypothetical protein